MMTDVVKEQISAFLDDELSADEAQLVVRRLMSDPELLSEAKTMLTVGHRVRGELSVADAGFASRVAAAASGEEAAVAVPNAGATRSVPRWFKYAGGGGVAAAVAVVALLSIRGPDAVEAPGTSVNAAVASPDVDTQQSGFEYTVPAATGPSGLVVADPQLASYLLNHSARSPSMMPGGMRGRILISDGDGVTQSDSDSAADSEDE